MDRLVKIWRVGKDFQLVHTLEGHSDLVLFVAFSPDSRLIASSSYDNTCRVWRVRTGKLLVALQGHSRMIRSFCWLNDRAVVTCSWDRTIKLWSVPEGKLMVSIAAHEHYISAVAISSDRTRLITGISDENCKVFEIVRGGLICVEPLRSTDDDCCCVAM
jgi:WD40 repeat protein